MTGYRERKREELGCERKRASASRITSSDQGVHPTVSLLDDSILSLLSIHFVSSTFRCSRGISPISGYHSVCLLAAVVSGGAATDKFPRLTTVLIHTPPLHLVSRVRVRWKRVISRFVASDLGAWRACEIIGYVTKDFTATVSKKDEKYAPFLLLVGFAISVSRVDQVKAYVYRVFVSLVCKVRSQ